MRLLCAASRTKLKNRIWSKRPVYGGLFSMRNIAVRTVFAQGREFIYTLERKMVKNMNLRIRRDGSIYVSANEFISDKEVDRFVGDKAAFIANAQDKFKKAAQREQRPEQYISGEKITLLGQEYILQVMWYLGITGRKIGHIAVLIGGQSFKYKQIEFDSELFETMVEAAKEFWQHVKDDTPPAVMPDDDETLKDLYSEHTEVMIELYPENEETTQAVQTFEDKVAYLQEVKGHIKNLQDEQKEIETAIKDIIKDNLLSFFNILLFVIGIIYIYVDVVIDKKSAFDTFRDCLFLGILLCNIVIGLIQDFRARKLCNQLIVVSNPKSLVLRSGKEIEISVDDIVLSDIVIYKSGDQIGVDGIVKEGMLEVNESLLTGESLIISKHPGDQIYSGTFVVGGHAKCQATSVGICNYAETLQDKAKEVKRPKSEIISSIRTIFRLIGSVVILFGIIMTIKFIVAYTKDTPPLVPMGDYLRGVLTSLISMIPSGMFLLTSVALSVGVINLSRKRVLVQEMYCIESLARVDTLCLDKTGTITDGTMRISSIIPLKDNSEGDLAQLIYTIVCATKDENPTAQAILKEYHRF